jgi:hypothetical protein
MGTRESNADPVSPRGGADQRPRRLLVSAAVDWWDFLRQIVAPVASGLILGGLVTLVTIAASPGWYGGWRLKKLLDLDNGLDREQFSRQRAVLNQEIHRRVTAIAVRTKVPTDWPMVVLRNLIAGAAVGANTALLIGAMSLAIPAPPGMTPSSWYFWPLGALVAITPVALNVLGTYALIWGNRAARFTKFYRRQFEQQGLPSSFTVPARPRPRWWSGMDPPEPRPPWWKESRR